MLTVTNLSIRTKQTKETLVRSVSFSVKKRRGPWPDRGERQRKEHDQQVHYAVVESTAF